MERTAISTPEAPAAIGPYSQAVAASGRLVFCSGQIALKPDGTLLEGTPAEQAAQAMRNLAAVLAAAGSSLDLVVKTTVFLSSMAHFAEVNQAYGAVFAKPPPARSTVAVAGLPLGVDVEIEAVALLPE
jgi:2-iminobutanoate/2-iminopropanoate deaminase